MRNPIIIAALTVAVLVCSATVASAARRGGVVMDVSWGQPEGSSYWTRLNLSAEQPAEVKTSVYFTMVPPSGVTFELGPEGYSALYMGSPYHIWSVRGFYLTTAEDVRGSFWWSSNCLPGPTVQIEDRSAVITNSTTIPLYVNEGKRWTKINVGESLDLKISPSRKGGKNEASGTTIIDIKTAPHESAPTCADMRMHDLQ